MKVYVALLWMWLQMLQIDASDYKDAGNYRKTPLTQCCQDDELYRPGLDRCLSRVNHFEQKTNDSLLYAVEDNNTFLVGASEFHLSYNLAACRTGYVATTTTEFQIFANGSLRVENTLFPPYQYCTNEVPSSDSSTIEFIARYCIPDPCAQDDIHCLRKCCPQGQAIDVPTQSCQPHPTSFNVSQMLKSNGGPIDVEDEEFLTLQFGLGFQCYNDDIIQVDDFGISSKGLLTSHDYVYFAARQRSHDHPTDQYCIDNFVNHNASVSHRTFNNLSCKFEFNLEYILFLETFRIEMLPNVTKVIRTQDQIFGGLSLFTILDGVIPYCHVYNICTLARFAKQKRSECHVLCFFDVCLLHGPRRHSHGTPHAKGNLHLSA